MQSRRDGGWILVAVGCLGLVLSVMGTVLLVREGLPGIVTAGPSVAGTPPPAEAGGADNGGALTSTPPFLSVGEVEQAAGLHRVVPSATPSTASARKYASPGAPACDPPDATAAAADPTTDVTPAPAAAAAAAARKAPAAAAEVTQ